MLGAVGYRDMHPCQLLNCLTRSEDKSLKKQGLALSRHLLLKCNEPSVSSWLALGSDHKRVGARSWLKTSLQKSGNQFHNMKAFTKSQIVDECAALQTGRTRGEEES